MAHDVFVSYPQGDKPLADALVHRLESDDIRCWVAPRDVRPGEEWAGAIVEAIHGCRVLVLVFSEDTNRSDHIVREVRAASDAHVAIVPLRIADVEPSPALDYYIGGTHWLDAVTEPVADHLAELSRTVARLLGTDRTSEPTAGPSPVSPGAAAAAPDATRRVGVAMWVGAALFAALAAVVVGVVIAGDGSQRASVTGDDAVQPDTLEVPDSTEPGASTTDAPSTAVGESVDTGTRRELDTLDDSAFGGFNGAIAVAIDLDGQVLVTDERNEAVRVFDGDGEYLRSFPARSPHGIAVGPNGDIYVVSYGDGHVQRFDSTGELISSWGEQGSGPGQLGRPVHIAVDAAGFLWITEEDPARVQKFGGEGDFHGVWTTSEEAVALAQPHGIAVSNTSDGELVYVGDLGQRAVITWDDTASPLGPPFEHTEPHGIDVDDSGHIYVAGNGTVTRHGPDGQLLEQWTSDHFDLAFDVAVDDAGTIWVTDQGSNVVVRFGY